MVFHKHHQLTAQNPHPYIDEMWEKSNYNISTKGLFVLLERTLINDFFEGIFFMNPSKDPPFNKFNEVLKLWISRFVDENP
jgi:hypothetical protein